MKKTLLAAVTASALLTGCVENIDMTAATDLYKAATISDQEVIALADQSAKQLDANNNVAPASNKYAKRLARITQGLNNEDGLELNFKVYLTDEMNAFAMPNGTVRVYSGLMDKLTDDEVRFVIGHEVGHVKLGHTRKEYQLAYAASAARKGASAAGGTVGMLSDSQLGDFTHKLVSAQFSQSQESASDTYAVKFMKRHGWDASAGIGVMKQFQAMEAASGGSHSVFSSHPASKDREEHIRDLL